MREERKMKYIVWFSAEGFDNKAYFDNGTDCEIFARLMAEQGRLVSVKKDGIDITDEFVTTIKIN